MALLIHPLFFALLVSLVVMLSSFFLISAARAFRRLRLLPGAPHREPPLLPVHRGRHLFGTHQSRECQVPLGCGEAFDVCVDALSLLRDARVERSSREEGVIEAVTRMSMRSWGIRVVVDVIPIDHRMSYVRFRLRPVMPTQIFDMGQTEEYIERMMTFLTMRSARHLPTRSPATPLLG